MVGKINYNFNASDIRKPGRLCASYPGFVVYFARNCQNATALAAATLRESTPWDMGIMTV